MFPKNERGGLEPPRPLQPPDITGNHLPILRPLFSILDTTILTDYECSAHQDYPDLSNVFQNVPNYSKCSKIILSSSIAILRML